MLTYNVHYILCFYFFQEKAQVDTLHFWDGERKIDIILGTIHILRQQKDWVGGSVLLTFRTVFILT